MIEQNKYLTKEEKNILTDSMDFQIKSLQNALQSESNFRINENYYKLHVMREGDE